MKFLLVLTLAVFAVAATSVQGAPNFQHKVRNDVQLVLPIQSNEEDEIAPAIFEKPIPAYENEFFIPNTQPEIIEIRPRQFFTNMREKASGWLKKVRSRLGRRRTTTEAPPMYDEEEPQMDQDEPDMQNGNQRPQEEY